MAPEPCPVLRLRRGLSFHTRDDGSIEAYVVKERRGFVVRWVSPEKLEQAFHVLFEGLNADSAARDLAIRCGVSEHQTAQLLKALGERGLVTEWRRQVSIDVDLDLYDRQIKFFDAFGEAGMGAELCRRLQNRRIVIVGLGALGSWIAFQCARAGVRRLVGVDFDQVEVSNLHRTILYDRDDVGHLKTERWTRFLKGVDPRVDFESHNLRIRCPEDLLPIIAGADLVFNQFSYMPEFLDPLRAGDSIARAGLLASVPVLNMTASWVGPLTIPGQSACLRCAKCHPEIQRALSVSFLRPDPGGAGAFAPRLVIAAGVAVWEAGRFLSGIDRPPSVDGVIALDTFTYRRHGFIELTPMHECKWCGGLAVSKPAVHDALEAGPSAAVSPEK